MISSENTQIIPVLKQLFSLYGVRKFSKIALIAHQIDGSKHPKQFIILALFLQNLLEITSNVDINELGHTLLLLLPFLDHEIPNIRQYAIQAIREIEKKIGSLVAKNGDDEGESESDDDRELKVMNGADKKSGKTSAN